MSATHVHQHIARLEPLTDAAPGRMGRMVSGRSIGTVVRGGPRVDFDIPLVLQVSRWDRLKDMGGVMQAFGESQYLLSQAHLALVGPAVDGVTDDPEGAVVLTECVEAWEKLPLSARDRIHLVSLDMSDVDENALMVNALQRAASVITQKSLAEGFGLTVAEGMWKRRAVVASAVGGIVDLIDDGTGLLLEDPHDLDLFGQGVAGLIADPDRRTRMGQRARARVRDRFICDRHLLDYSRLVRTVLTAMP
jgi:trehalose synthase